jgi:transglutaminase-like putative cysteine protease
VNLARRRTLRLRLRDLAAASAFSAVALSGALPLPVLGLFVLALASSLFGVRPFATQRAWAVIALLGAAVVLFGLAFRGVIDLVIAAVAFATLVTGHRLLSEPTPGTDQQVLLASLLLIAGAAALSGDAWYAICLLGFGVFACLALGLAVVEGPVERDEDLPLGPVLRQVSLGVAVALVGGIAFFVLFPRLSWNVAARRTGPGVLGGTTGMTDRVRLGGGGDIKTSARVVFRARLEPDPGRERLDRYWVGRRFAAFDGREWRGTGTARAPQPRVMWGEARRALTQRIELLPAYGSKTLVGVEQPVMFGPAFAIGTGGQAPVSLVDVRGEEVRFAADSPSYAYTVMSRDEPLPGDETEETLAALRETPPELDPRVAQLAATVAGDETDPERLARRLEGWLQRNLAYTLELPGDVADPLADFLFVRKEGHCEHFATALAVMLRTRGVPARIVGGFFGGERLGARYVVRAGDAHAWVEAWVPGRGWTTFDATPEDGRSGRPTALLSRVVDAWERIEELWRARVVDYSIIDQWTFVRNLVRPPRGSRDDGAEPEAATSVTRRPSSRALLAGLLAAGLFFAAWRRFTRPRAPEHPAATFLARLERRLAEAQVARREGEDLEALAHRLSAEGHRLAPGVAKATRRYLEARFGQRPLTRAEEAQLLAGLGPEISGAAPRPH